MLWKRIPERSHQTVPEPEANRVRHLAALKTDELSTGDYTIAAMLPSGFETRPVIFRRFKIVDADRD